jgi:hypothetical protein
MVSRPSMTEQGADALRCAARHRISQLQGPHVTTVVTGTDRDKPHLVRQAKTSGWRSSKPSSDVMP